MSDQPHKTSELKFTVKMDENDVPLEIEWESSDNGESGKCKAAFFALWDAEEGSTMRIDLWTKHFLLEEMRHFFYQNLATLTDTYERATEDKKVVAELREFNQKLARMMEITTEGGSSGGDGQGNGQENDS